MRCGTDLLRVFVEHGLAPSTPTHRFDHIADGMGPFLGCRLSQ